MHTFYHYPTSTLTINTCLITTHLLLIITTMMILHMPPQPTVAARLYYPPVTSAPSTALPLVAADGHNYATLRRGRTHGYVFHRGEVDNCMPKGMRRSSAPSRYVNYQTLSCRTSPHSVTAASAPPNP